MFDDEIIPGGAPAKVSPAAQSRSGPDSCKPSPLQEAAVILFDQLQGRLQRYLALFQHLQRGKPGHSLRGWVFRVGHSLALKQCNATRRNRQLAENFFVGRAPNPEAQLAGRQRYRTITWCFACLFRTPPPVFDYISKISSSLRARRATVTS
jgi:hypothetical protein